MSLNSYIEQFDDTISIHKDCLEVDDYELKILLLTSVLADNNLAYRGTLKTMCEWLGIKSNANNNKRIKAAINNLANKNFIFCNIEGRTYHISIRKDGLKQKKVVKMRKIWIKTLKKHNKEMDNISISWISLLRVFIYLLSRDNQSDLLTDEIIASDLNVSKSTVSNAIRCLSKCELIGIKIRRETQRQQLPSKEWITYGSEIEINPEWGI